LKLIAICSETENISLFYHYDWNSHLFRLYDWNGNLFRNGYYFIILWLKQQFVPTLWMRWQFVLKMRISVLYDWIGICSKDGNGCKSNCLRNMEKSYSTDGKVILIWSKRSKLFEIFIKNVCLVTSIMPIESPRRKSNPLILANISICLFHSILQIIRPPCRLFLMILYSTHQVASWSLLVEKDKRKQGD
jgi:hypothetical protein